MNIALRPYQEEAIAAVYSWFEKNTGNPLVVLPTGAGKSLVIAGLVHGVLSSFPDERFLLLTHVKELVEQNEKALLRCWPEAPAGVYSAGLKRREVGARILFAGIQSAYKRAKEIGWVDLVLVDECHLIPKDGFGMYRQLLDALRSMNPKMKVIGLTATPFRTDSGGLDHGDDRMFHGIAYTADLVALIKDGYLSPVTSKATHSEINTTGVHRVGGEFVAKELEEAAEESGLVVRQVDEIVARGVDRRAWLLFCCSVQHALHVAKEVEDRGISVATVFGDTEDTERDEAIARFRNGSLRCLVNVNVLTTGFDAPHVDLIALLRPTCSPGLYVQMVGRGLRLSPGKKDALVLDFGGNISRHGPIDAVEIRQPKKSNSVEGDERPRSKVCPKCETIVAIPVRQCPDCGHEWPAPEPDLESRPDEASTLVLGTHPTGGIERWKVHKALYSRHVKRGAPDKPPTLAVEYVCGFQQRVREWVCFEHEGYARRKAETWWRHHGGTAPCPDSVDLALVRIECGELLEPVSVTVDVRGEYPELKAVRMGAREPGENECAPPASPPVSDEAIPF